MQIVFLVIAALLALPLGVAQAYVGPGLGLGAIGAILGVIFSILLAILAFFWYPIKRLFGIGKKKRESQDDDLLE